jgi:glycosyltransferase involved in cell wall biosynthesis
MRIGIDSRAVKAPPTASRGIGRYVRGLFDALSCQLSVVSCQLKTRDPSSNWELRTDNCELLWADEPGEVPNLDIWIASSPLQRCPVRTRSGPALAAIWYDCSPDAEESLSGTFWGRGSVRWAWYCSVLEEIKYYPLVLTLSRHAKLDLVERHGFDPGRTAVIGADCDPIFRPVRCWEENACDRRHVERLGIPGGFIVFVGGQDPRKGAYRLAEAWSLVPAELRRSVQLVYAYDASSSHRESVLSLGARRGLRLAQGDAQLLQDLRITPDIVFTGAVSDRQLVALYRRSLAAVYPSLYEGFGLPILEAARCGTAVIHGANTSQPEVLGGAGIAVDASDPHAITGAIRLVLASPADRRRIAACGLTASEQHSWERTAASALSALAAPTSTSSRPALAAV